MPDIIFKISYLAGLVAEIIIRVPHHRRHRQHKIVTDQINRQEDVVLV